MKEMTDVSCCLFRERGATPKMPWGQTVANDNALGLFAYVANDPINNVDPDGQTCVALERGRGYSCRVDNPGKLTKEQVAAANKAYTAAVNKLMHNPDKTVRITLMGRVANVKAGDVGRGLIKAHVTGGDEAGKRASTRGGTLTPGGAVDGRPQITIHRQALISDRSGGTVNIMTDLRKTFIHEGIHTAPQVRAFAPLFEKDPVWFNNFHTQYYNRASSLFHDKYDD